MLEKKPFSGTYEEVSSNIHSCGVGTAALVEGCTRQNHNTDDEDDDDDDDDQEGEEDPNGPSNVCVWKGNNSNRHLACNCDEEQWEDGAVVSAAPTALCLAVAAGSLLLLQ